MSLPALRLPALAVLALAPALAAAQSSAEPDVDPAIVGTWTLDAVEDAGPLGAMGAEVQAMTARFEADGEGHVSMTLLQDADTYERERSFAFETEDGRIVTEDGDDQPSRYAVLDDGRLEIRHPGGLVVVLARTGA